MTKRILRLPSTESQTVSSERGRAVKLSITGGRLVLSVTNPNSGSATEEIEVEYGAEPLDIGFNSRYLMDIAAQIEGEVAVLKLADPGSPTLIQDKDAKGALSRANADAGVVEQSKRVSAFRWPGLSRPSASLILRIER